MLLTDEEIKKEINLLLSFAHENIRRLANGLPRLSGPEPYFRIDAFVKDGANKEESLQPQTVPTPSSAPPKSEASQTSGTVKESAARAYPLNSQRTRLSEFQPAIVYVKSSHAFSPKPPLSSKVTVTVPRKPFTAPIPAVVARPSPNRAATTAPATSRTTSRGPLAQSSNRPSAPIRPASLPAARVMSPRMQKIVREPPPIEPSVHDALGWGAAVHERPVMAPYPPLPKDYVVIDPYRDQFGSKSNKTAG
ncbi:hypothetical protein HDU89_006411 [Geranomyces variabilis]|nr:hypothetical protein HDU89_006411 [Geranomyces variabilis]